MSVSALSDIHTTLNTRADEPRRDPEDEPFGQRGVRQYLGVIVNWVCLISLVFVVTFWYRSAKVYDRLEWRGTDANLRISSVTGRIVVEANTFIPRGGRALGWVYKGGTIRRVMDGWEPSILKTVGIQFSPGPTRTDATGGFVFRVKWYFVAAVLLIVPLWRGVAAVVQSRRRATEEAE